MNNMQTNELKEQVFSICHKLTTLRPPIDLRSKKADETLRFWLPEISWDFIELCKKEYLAKIDAEAREEERG